MFKKILLSSALIAVSTVQGFSADLVLSNDNYASRLMQDKAAVLRDSIGGSYVRDSFEKFFEVKAAYDILMHKAGILGQNSASFNEAMPTVGAGVNDLLGLIDKMYSNSLQGAGSVYDILSTLTNDFATDLGTPFTSAISTYNSDIASLTYAGGVDQTVQDALSSLRDEINDFATLINNPGTWTDLAGLASSLETTLAGTLDPQSLTEYVDSRMDTVDTNISSLSSTLSTVSGNVTTLGTNLGTLSTTVGELETDIDGLTTSVGTLTTNLSTVSGNVTTLGTNLGTLSTTVGGLETDVGTLATNLSTVSGNVTTLGTEVDTLKDRVAFLLTALRWR